MKITLLSDDAIRLERTDGTLVIEALSADQAYSPFHMLASSLAFCTFSVLHAWGSQAGISANELTIDVRWTFADNPHRVDSISLTFNWPLLPAKRIDAARRAAELCTVHATLSHPPTITVAGAAGDDAIRNPRDYSRGALRRRRPRHPQDARPSIHRRLRRRLQGLHASRRSSAPLG